MTRFRDAVTGSSHYNIIKFLNTKETKAFRAGSGCGGGRRGQNGSGSPPKYSEKNLDNKMKLLVEGIPVNNSDTGSCDSKTSDDINI